MLLDTLKSVGKMIRNTVFQKIRVNVLICLKIPSQRFLGTSFSLIYSNKFPQKYFGIFGYWWWTVPVKITIKKCVFF